MAVSSWQKRTGRAILRVFATKAVQAIPLVGVTLTLGMDLLRAVKDEFARVDSQALTDQEVTDALHSLSHDEARSTVDAVLDSPQGKETMQRLSPAAREEVRRHLLALPSEFDRILGHLEGQEREDAIAAADKKRDEEEVARRAEEARFRKCQGKLKKQLNAKKYAEAYATVREILAISPTDVQALKVELWLEKRLNKSLPEDTLQGGCLGGCLSLPLAAAAGGAGFLIGGVLGIGIALCLGILYRVRRRKILRGHATRKFDPGQRRHQPPPARVGGAPGTDGQRHA
jgi:hypothetical protein